MAMCMPLEYFIFAILYLCIYRLTDGQVLTSSEENEIERYITSFLECKNVPGEWHCNSIVVINLTAS